MATSLMGGVWKGGRFTRHSGSQVAKPKAGRTNRETQRKAAAKNRANSGIVARRTKALSSGEGTRHFEYRVRRESAKTRTYSQNKYVVEDRIIDRLKGGGTATVQDWSARASGSTPHQALRDSWDSGLGSARSTSQLHRRVAATIAKHSAVSNQIHRLRTTSAKIKGKLAGNSMSNTISGDSYHHRAKAEYESELKKAKLFTAAKNNAADPQKIAAIQKRVMDRHKTTVDKANRLFRKVNNRIARLESRAGKSQVVIVPNRKAI